VLPSATFLFNPSAISLAIIGNTFGPIDVVINSTSPILLYISSFSLAMLSASK
jgi:hypothetical protein